MRLGWGTRENGLALAVVGIGSAIVQGFVVRRAIPALGERRAAMLAYACAALAYLFYAGAYAPWILVIGIALQSVSAISGPAVQALVSARAGPDRQGAMQGALSSFQGLTAIAAPLLSGWVFGLFTGPASPIHFPGAPFLMAAIAYIVALWSISGLPPRIEPTS